MEQKGTWGACKASAPLTDPRMLLWHCEGGFKAHSLLHPCFAWCFAQCQPLPAHSALGEESFIPGPCREQKSVVAFMPLQHVSICSFGPFLFGRSQLKTTHPTCNSSLAPNRAGGSCSRPPASFCSHHPPPSHCHQAFHPLQTALCLVKQSLILTTALQISRDTCPCINRCKGGSKRPRKHL